MQDGRLKREVVNPEIWDEAEKTERTVKNSSQVYSYGF